MASPNEQYSELVNAARFAWLIQHFRREKPYHIVLKLTTDCNLRCKYCYVSAGEAKMAMDPETVEKLLDQVAEDNPQRIEVLFHGGEPLLEFARMKEIVQMLNKKPYGPRLKFSVQTNATLVTTEIAQFLKQTNMGVGASLDGPPATNDLTRVNAGGRGSFAAVVSGIQRLKEAGVGVGLICVVTRQNVHSLVDFLELCTQQGITGASFLPFFPGGRGSEYREDLEPSIADLCSSTKQCIDWLVSYNSKRESGRLIVRDFSVFVRNILSERAEQQKNICSSWQCGAGRRHIGLDTNGDVYICDTAHGSSSCILGNIHRESLDSMLQSGLVSSFNEERLQGVPECQKCDLRTICYGGCLAQNIAYYGADGIHRPSHLCGWYKVVIPYLKGLIDRGEAKPEWLCDTCSTKVDTKGVGC